MKRLLILLVLLVVLVVLVGRALRRITAGILEGASGRTPSERPPAAVKLVRDPVCGTHIAPQQALSCTSRGTVHYFCSEACLETFRTRA